MHKIAMRQNSDHHNSDFTNNIYYSLPTLQR